VLSPLHQVAERKVMIFKLGRDAKKSNISYPSTVQRKTAINEPTNEALKLTKSLSSQPQPRNGTVFVPQV